MNKRFCKLGSYAAKALLLTAICGTTYSCKDGYTLDDMIPSWLGSSIYEYLDEDGHYTNFVKLVDDLNYKEVLARTGSKTLFVADDDAFKTFYANNAWGVHSYDQLTKSQKKLLLNSAMINNAYLLEMMSSTSAGSGDNDQPEKGQCLRRETAADVTDSISHFSSDELPVNYSTTDIDYWARFRNSGKGIYLALDGTAPMMTHFLTAQMANKNITDEDFKIITGQERGENDAFVYDCKVVKQDVTCQNGYVDVLDKVLVTPQNMAEVLRTNSDTKIFSHLLDRFSAPFYSSTLTERYRLIYGNEVDSVFQKRYFSIRSQGGANLFSDAGTDPTGNPTGNTVFDKNSNKPLPYDPGWNTYLADDKSTKEQDMGAIFCPNDKKLMNYFFSQAGGGRFLVSAYATEYLSKIDENTTDLDLVYHALDLIPRQTIRALINNLMKESFVSSVPSKFESIKNSAQDAMFDETDDYHRGKIEKVLLANNGVIYVMDEVTTPAEYAAVSAPAYVETDKRVFNWAIQSASLGGIPSNYYAYLLAMSSRFSFFVPADGFYYVDPMSFYNPDIDKTGSSPVFKATAYRFTWDETKSQPKVEAYYYNYNLKDGSGSLGEKQTLNISSTCYGNRLKDMLETHTIIHEDNSESIGIDETETGVDCNKHYYVSKNGAVVYTKNATLHAKGMTVLGGWQLNDGTECSVTGFDDKSAQTNGYGNGFAYTIDKPMQPTIESVYSAMYNNSNFSKFFELCQTDGEVLSEIGLTSSEQTRFNIFQDRKGLPCYDKNTGDLVSNGTNVRFFSNYRYTIYVPTNEAMEKAEAAGLPTWQSVRDYLELDLDADQRKELTDEQLEVRNVKAKAMVTEIVNFVKNHFQDNSVFADAPSMKATQYETATVNSETGVYCKLTVSSEGNGTLSVKDGAGNTHKITSDKNIIVRDYITNGGSSVNALTITASSSAVMHGIDGVLNYKSYANGRYDSDWASAAKARAYLKKYQLKK